MLNEQASTAQISTSESKSLHKAFNGWGMQVSFPKQDCNDGASTAFYAALGAENPGSVVIADHSERDGDASGSSVDSSNSMVGEDKAPGVALPHTICQTEGQQIDHSADRLQDVLFGNSQNAADFGGSAGPHEAFQKAEPSATSESTESIELSSEYLEGGLLTQTKNTQPTEQVNKHGPNDRMYEASSSRYNPLLFIWADQGLHEHCSQGFELSFERLS